MSPSEQKRVFRFGDYSFDPQTGELLKDGRRLKIQGQPVAILAMLLERPGEIVTREEFQKKLWPKDTFVDFEHSLNAAIKRLRDAMNDSADAPRYVETLARRGYRFIGVLERPHAIQPRVPSVAVLPFANISADAENEFFADGVTEDVIAHLAKIRSLKVISRTSVMAYKKGEGSLREIGERLGVATVVEGSIRRMGNRVRIVAQLVDAVTDELLWAEIYDRDLTDIFGIQSDVALKIANALRAQLSNDERARVGQRPTQNFEAYEFYIRGRNSYYRFTDDGFRRSLIDYHAAVARDPSFALAWASLAATHTEMCTSGFAGSSPEDTVKSARTAAARALEIDDQLAEAHSVSAFIRFGFDFDWVGAEREFLAAIELSPNNAVAHGHYSWLCSSLERYDDALREVRRAHELDPLLVQTDVATTLLRAGRINEALEDARRSLLYGPASPRSYSNLGWALIFHDDHAAGIESLERASWLAPDSTLFLSQLGEACAITGDVERARNILQQLHDRAAREFVSPYHFAYVYAGLGEADAAIDWLERAFQRHSGAIYGIKGSFLFRNLRTHPRFKSLLQRMNLP
jgi:adenylate cyclase